MRSASIPRGGRRAAPENKEDLLPCYRRVGDVSRRLVTMKYTSTKTKANPMIGKPIYITSLQVGGLLNITLIRSGSARRAPQLSAVRSFALGASRPEASVAVVLAPRAPTTTLL
jgi:hypothetical protein